MTTGEDIKIKPVITPDDIVPRAKKIVKEIYVDEKIKNYIVDIVFATRTPEEYNLKDLKTAYRLRRLAQGHYISDDGAAKAYAFMQGRGYVTPEDQ